MGTATFVSVARTKFKESKICLTQQQSNESTQKKMNLNTTVQSI